MTYSIEINDKTIDNIDRDHSPSTAQILEPNDPFLLAVKPLIIPRTYEED